MFFDKFFHRSLHALQSPNSPFISFLRAATDSVYLFLILRMTTDSGDPKPEIQRAARYTVQMLAINDIGEGQETTCLARARARVCLRVLYADKDSFR